MLKHFCILIVIAFFITLNANAQQHASISTDFALLRNFKKTQHFWAFGQTVQAHFHFTPKNGAYVWVSYFTSGKFKNNLVAMAKSATTQPSQINFNSKSSVSIKTFSVGWKRYIKGFAYAEESWNLYGYAGYGLLVAKVNNIYNTSIDTSFYLTPANPINGEGSFRRLTIDAGIGGEIPVGGDIFIYFEARAGVPVSEYPSKYLLRNDNAPFVVTANSGMRILF